MTDELIKQKLMDNFKEIVNQVISEDDNLNYLQDKEITESMVNFSINHRTFEANLKIRFTNWD